MYVEYKKGVVENILKKINKNKYKHLMAILVAFLMILPYLIGYYLTPKGQVFTGFIFESVDGFTYLSKMSNAEHGLSFLNNYTIGDNYGGYHFLMYILLGKISIMFNIPYIIAYHILRVILSLVFVYVLYDFFIYIGVNDIKKQNLIAFITIFLSNNEFIKDFSRIYSGMRIDNSDQFIDSTPFTSMLYTPHYVLLMILIILLLKYTIIYTNNRLNNSIIMGILLLMISFVHPFSAVALGIYSGIYILFYDIKNKEISIKNIFYLSLLGVIPLPYLGYSLYAFTHYTTLIEWNKQAIISRGNFMSKFLSTGLVFMCSYILIFIKCNWNKDRNLITWFLTLSILASILPFQFALRLQEATGIYIGILIGFLLYEYVLPISKKLLIIILIALSFNSLWLTIEPTFMSNNINSAMYTSLEQYELNKFIKEKVDYNDLIFSNYYNGVFIPAYTGKKVVLGHHHESANFEYWINILHYVEETGDLNVLEKNNIRYYLVDSKNENQINPIKNYQIVFKNKEYKLYKLY